MSVTTVPITGMRAHHNEALRLFKEAEAKLNTPDLTAEAYADYEKLMEAGRKHRAAAMGLKEIEEAAALMQADIVEAEKKLALPTKASQGFDVWGEFLATVWLKQTQNREDNRLVWFNDDPVDPSQRKEISGLTGAAGGFLMPGDFQANLQSVMSERGIVRSRATVLPMRRRSLKIPILDQTSTSAGTPHWFGGMAFYWQEESSQKTESSPTFREIELIAKKLIGYTRSSDEALDDAAISLEGFLQGPMGFVGGAVFMEDYAFLRGNGTGQPRGVIDAGATIAVSRATPSHINYADLVGMLQAFLPSGRGVWLASQTALAELLTMNGPAGNPSYLWGSAMAGVPGTLLGLPIVFTEKLPALGTKGDIGLFDFSYYVIGDRQATTVDSTKAERFQYDQTSWRMTHRVDGQPWLSAPLTYIDGTTKVSPFVVLN